MTKIILAYELSGEGVSKSYIAKRLGVSRRTIIRWSKAIAEHGSLDAFLGVLPARQERYSSEAQDRSDLEAPHLGFARKTSSMLRPEDPILPAKRV